MGYGAGKTESREFTTAPGGDYNLNVAGHDLYRTCTHKVTLTKIFAGTLDARPVLHERSPSSPEDQSPAPGMTWGRLKVICR